ncbi:hypothetical protein HY734_00940 [Candidatus Uhrbacteria bacterium]|nr:hypothetical protein [Candidatus Uhrbacteria bacterium]
MLFWMKIFGWFFFAVPLVAYVVFSIWMIKEATKDDENVGIFFNLMFVLWVIGAGILGLSYLVDVTG